MGGAFRVSTLTKNVKMFIFQFFFFLSFNKKLFDVLLFIKRLSKNKIVLFFSTVYFTKLKPTILPEIYSSSLNLKNKPFLFFLFSLFKFKKGFSSFFTKMGSRVYSKVLMITFFTCSSLPFSLFNTLSFY